MGKCDNCRLRKESAKAFDIHWHGEDDCPYDKCPVPDFPKTHADRIRAMSVEEMAEWFIKIQYDVADYYDGGHAVAPELPTMKDSWLDWLKQEGGNGETN